MGKRGRYEQAATDGLEGTVEGLSLAHFEREKAAYEARTGEKVWGTPPVPVTRTPIKTGTAASDAAETTEGDAQGEE
jgi:hypothetical protein